MREQSAAGVYPQDVSADIRHSQNLAGTNEIGGTFNRSNQSLRQAQKDVNTLCVGCVKPSKTALSARMLLHKSSHPFFLHYLVTCLGFVEGF